MGMENEEQNKGQSCKTNLLPPEIRDEYQEITRCHRKLLERLADRETKTRCSVQTLTNPSLNRLKNGG